MAWWCSNLRGSVIRKFAVVLAGGRGERFWPLSQPDLPKQFLNIFNNRPLILQTIDRIKNYFKRNERLLIIPKELKKVSQRYVGQEHIFFEPMRRNTGPAICLTAMYLKKKFGNGVLHVMPADHLIGPKKDFIDTLRYGQRLAQRGHLVTYGIKPNRPETGYGYIKLDKKIGEHRGIIAYHGGGFTEKPSRLKASQYLRTKKYLWNSGIFTFAIETILEEIERFMPEVHDGVTSFMKSGKIGYFQRLPDISIDYGVMEKSNRLCVVQGKFWWDDVGSWLALERYFKKDKNQNICIGDVKVIDVHDSIMHGGDMPLRAYGIRGLIVVVSPHGVLICKKEKAQDIKKLFK